MSEKRRKDRGSKPPSAKADPLVRNLEGFVVEEIEVSSRDVPFAPTTGVQRKPRARIWPKIQAVAVPLGLVAILVAATLATRGTWPVDETRLLAIAWEMWTRGDWLVPRFNGAVEAWPPFFFWLVQFGWRVLGAVDWWPRVLPALFLLGSFVLTARIALLLWAGQGTVARQVPLVMVGSFTVALSVALLALSTMAMFFTLLFFHAMLWRWRYRDHRLWLLMGFTLGVGLLACGGLLLLYVLPVALLAPLWGRRQPTIPWKYWYADLLKACVLAAVIFALWALPAAGRMDMKALWPLFTSPTHMLALDLLPGQRPWWWLLFMLPWLAFPWSLWPLPWLRLWHIRSKPLGNGFSFCLVWAVCVVAVFSLLPDRQPQFLLPLVPAFFLVVAWLLLDERHEDHDHSKLATAITFPVLILGGVLAVLPHLPRVAYLPDFLWGLSPFVGVGIVGLGLALGWMPIPTLPTRLFNMAATVTVLTALGLLALGWQLQPHYDFSKPAGLIARAQQQNLPVAHVGPYDGEYHFPGQLRAPLTVLTPEQVPAWLAANGQGLLISHRVGWQPPVIEGVSSTVVVLEQPHGDEVLRLWKVGS